MGSLYYGESGTEIVIDDRLLVDLRAAIAEKMGRNERFLLSWHEPADVGDGLSSVWLDPSIPLRFHIRRGVDLTVDADHVERMVADASSPDGLTLPRAETEDADSADG